MARPATERKEFLSTPSARRATVVVARGRDDILISIHALREEGDRRPNRLHSLRAISIHALREEGDGESCRCPAGQLYFYPRPPRGGRLPVGALSRAHSQFLSTPSARRATGEWIIHLNVVGISIHALREEGDSPAPGMSCTQHNFYPRPPRGGRPSGFNTFLRAICISIHALREEGDPTRSAQPLNRLPNFYPRPPRGGRPR